MVRKHIGFLLLFFCVLSTAVFSSSYYSGSESELPRRYQNNDGDECTSLLSNHVTTHELNKIVGNIEKYRDDYIFGDKYANRDGEYALNAIAYLMAGLSPLPYLQAAYDATNVPAIGYSLVVATYFSVFANMAHFYLAYADKLSGKTPEENVVLLHKKIPVIEHVVCNVLGAVASLHLISMGYFFNAEDVRIATAVIAGLTGYAFAAIGFYETFNFFPWFREKPDQSEVDIQNDSNALYGELSDLLLNNPEVFKLKLSEISTFKLNEKDKEVKNYDNTGEEQCLNKQCVKDTSVYSGTTVLVSSVYVTFSVLAYELLGLMGIEPYVCVALSIISTIPFSTLIMLSSNETLGCVFDYVDNWINNVTVKTIDNTVFPIVSTINPGISFVLSALSAVSQYYIAYVTCENYEWMNHLKYVLPPLYYAANTIFESYTATSVVNRMAKFYFLNFGDEKQKYMLKANQYLPGLCEMLGRYRKFSR